MFKKRFSIIAIFLVSLLVLSSCNSGNKDTSNGDAVDSSSTTDSANKNNYDPTAAYTYEDPLVDVPPDEIFRFPIEFDPSDMGYDASEIADVFIDPALTSSAKPDISYDKDAGEIVIKPSTVPVFWNPDGIGCSHPRHWGYAQRYYAARFVDEQGNKLSKPVVTSFTVRNEMKAPSVTYFFKDGFIGFRWDAIPNADKYVFYMIILDVEDDVWEEGTLKNEMIVLASIGADEETEFIYDDRAVFEDFSFAHPWISSHEIEGKDYFICMQAKAGGLVSQISNPIHSSEFRNVLITVLIEPEDDDMAVSRVVKSIDDIGVFKLLRTLDDTRIRMPVSYRIDEAKVRDVSEILSNSFDPGEMEVLYIPFDVINTPLYGYVLVKEWDDALMPEQLKRLKEREEDVISSYGRLQVGLNFAADTLDISPQGQSQLSEYSGSFRIFGTNAFSAYLAKNMLHGVEEIDIQNFIERFDDDTLASAILEAMYQNPLILGINNAFSDKFRTTLFVDYQNASDGRKKKQAEIQSTVQSVINAIITPGMAEIDKEIAINNYLCETAIFDYAALENGEANDFLFVDSKFNDSFTAYGILVNKVGVCEGYAAAFKLLADEAGLESIVVTGNLYGTLPHSWNRVKIGNDWMSIDVTNNANKGIKNALLNLPDSIAETILIENDKYMSTDTIAAYRRGQNENLEFYRHKGLYFSPSAISTHLAEGLKKNGEVVLRTEYDLPDKKFNEIVRETFMKSGFDDLNGGQWLGTIYLTVEGQTPGSMQTASTQTESAPIQTESAPAQTETASAQPAVLQSSTKIIQDFNKVNSGMNLNDVNNLAGSTGIRQYLRTYFWKYTNGYTLEVSWYDDGDMTLKEIRYDDDYSIFIDSAVTLAQAESIYARVDAREKVTYEEFKSTFGTPCILYSVSYFDAGDSLYYYWMDTKGNHVIAGFDEGICRYFYMR